jgi:Cu2+-exporting ATPase
VESSEQSTAAPCPHCGAPVVAGSSSVYCCTGCEGAAALISSAGWDEFYSRREGFSPRPDKQSFEGFDTDVYQSRHGGTTDTGEQLARLQVGGVQCSACVWLVEHMLKQYLGVSAAHVSYGTNVATVTWNPEVTSLSQIASQIGRLGYEPLEPETAPAADRKTVVRLGVASFCAMNVMLIQASVYLGDASGDMLARYSTLFAWASLALATPAVFISTTPFFEGSARSLRARRVSMDVPIAIAIAVMFAHGIYGTFSGAETFLDSLTMLIAFLLGGRLLVSSGKNRSIRAAQELLANAPQTALVERAGAFIEADVSDVRVGATVVCSVGSRIPLDVELLRGSCSIDASHVSGESQPKSIAVGDEILAGCLVLDGQVFGRVLREQQESTVSRTAALVREALDGRTETISLADQVAPWFTGAVLLAAGGTFAFWTSTAGATAGLKAAVAVMVVACPCALALAAPTTVALGVAAAARRGAFVRRGDVLSALGEVNVLAIDKTGTLTDPIPRVTRADDQTLQLAAAIELGNRHPVARAIVAELERRGLANVRANEVSLVELGGVEGAVNGRHLAVLPDGPERVSVIDRNSGAEIGSIALRSQVRSAARSTLQSLGLEVTILSGDHSRVVEVVASTLGIAEWYGQLTPADKAEWVTQRESSGTAVLFVGDGLNDAPALAAATVSVAMGDGSSAAMHAADVVVMEPSLRPLVALRTVGAVTSRVVRQNAAFALTYNVSAVALAMTGVVGPLLAAIMMPLSSLAVVFNALSVEKRVARQLTRGVPKSAGSLPTLNEVQWTS